MNWQAITKHLHQGNEVVKKLLLKLPSNLRLDYIQKEELSPEEEALQEIWEAHREWVNAINNFNHVSEPDLIDYSVYNIETKQKRYVYLVKQAKDQQIDVASLKKICDKI